MKEVAQGSLMSSSSRIRIMSLTVHSHSSFVSALFTVQGG